MKLSPKEKHLLATIELQAGTPIKEIERQTGMPEHAIRYLIKKLATAKLLGPKRPIIDMNLLGYAHYTFFFSLTSESHKVKQSFLRYLSRSPTITWMFELGGDFQYGATISVKHINSVTRFLHDVSQKFGNIFFEKVYSLQLSYNYFGRRYLTPHKLASQPIHFELHQRLEELDDSDKQILGAMANSDYTTLTQLSTELKIPLATLERRKQKLEQRGVIRGYFHWIEAGALGMLPYVLLIYMKGISPDFKRKLLEFSRREPQVVYFIECMGNWDFEIGIEVDSMKEVTNITQKLYDHFPEDMRTLKVIPILNYYKFKNYSLESQRMK
jgi:DNA-binding Lrp family transcriptional regulator